MSQTGHQLENGPEAAEEVFRDLVARHLGLVYSTALRLVAGDAHLAQDVAQIVFKDLALKRAWLPPNPPVAGWLYRHACFTAAKVVRGEARRRAREREAAAMPTDQPEDEPSWEQIAPLLDGLMRRLNARERDAMVLRYFSGRSLGEVAGELNTSPEAARKLVSRGLAKLRALLIKRGVTSSSAGLMAALAHGAVSPTPEGLATVVSSFALAETSLPLAAKAAAFFALMTKLKIAAACALVAGAVSFTVWRQSEINQLRASNDNLRLEAAAAKNSGPAPLPPSPAATDRNRSEFHELLQLRGEVAVLRARLAEQTHKVAAAKEEDKTPGGTGAGAAASFRAAGTVRVPSGQTLVTGGWLTPSGGRNFIFAKSTIQTEPGRAPTVMVGTSFVEMTGDAVNQAGFNQLLTESGESQRAALYTRDQWDAQMQTLTNLEGVRFLARPRILTRGDGGTPATMTMTGNGTNYVFSVNPRITSEGDAVDLSYDGRVDLPSGAPTDQP